MQHLRKAVRFPLPPSLRVSHHHSSAGQYAQLNIQGPNSRKLLQLATDTNMSNEAFPFRTMKEIAIGFARVYWYRLSSLSLSLPLSLSLSFSLLWSVYSDVLSITSARITYVGELGYELFIPVEHAMHVYPLPLSLPCLPSRVYWPLFPWEGTSD